MRAVLLVLLVLAAGCAQPAEAPATVPTRGPPPSAQPGAAGTFAFEYAGNEALACTQGEFQGPSTDPTGFGSECGALGVSGNVTIVVADQVNPQQKFQYTVAKPMFQKCEDPKVAARNVTFTEPFGCTGVSVALAGDATRGTVTIAWTGG